MNSGFDAYVFDMDGTIYLGNQLLPGVIELFEALRFHQRRFAFLTNNSTRSREEYADKLTGLGLQAVPDDIVTSATITAAWIREHEPDSVCFPIGEASLVNALREEGICVSSDPTRITTVISSFDRTLDYAKLRTAFAALWKRPDVRFYATHPDAYCPLADGGGDPDAAAVTAALEASTGRACEMVFGKPSPRAIEVILTRLGIGAGRTIMIGDRLGTDIAMGLSAGCTTALVLTGESQRSDVAEAPADQQPHLVLDRIDVLIEDLPRDV